jgi:hypothetical protein
MEVLALTQIVQTKSLLRFQPSSKSWCTPIQSVIVADPANHAMQRDRHLTPEASDALYQFALHTYNLVRAVMEVSPYDPSVVFEHENVFKPVYVMQTDDNRGLGLYAHASIQCGEVICLLDGDRIYDNYIFSNRQSTLRVCLNSAQSYYHLSKTCEYIW